MSTAFKTLNVNELTLHRVHDRLNIYEQQLLFHRQEIDELKKITMENTKENQEINKMVFRTLSDVKKEFRTELNTITLTFNKTVVATQKGIIGILITIILQTFLVVLAVMLQKM